MNIVVIGAGNVATHLAEALKNAGENIVQVFSRTELSAKTLADKLRTAYTTDISNIERNSDVYIYALKDDALAEIIEQMPTKNGIHLHTAGSVPMSIFAQKKTHFGVLYPLQTFTKSKKVDFANIPLFIEASDDKTEKTLHDLAQKISKKVYCANSTERGRLHLAAVFACNFVNHLFAIADELLGDVPFSELLPLITETVAKAQTMPPKDAQTGPAHRGDTATMEKHLQLLASNKAWQTIYRNISDDIMRCNDEGEKQ